MLVLAQIPALSLSWEYDHLVLKSLDYNYCHDYCMCAFAKMNKICMGL